MQILSVRENISRLISVREVVSILAIARWRNFHHDLARIHWAPDHMISKSGPLAPLQSSVRPRSTAATSIADRLSLRACVLIVAAVSTLLWLGIGFFAGKLVG
jgi:hypothetical protein